VLGAIGTWLARKKLTVRKFAEIGYSYFKAFKNGEIVFSSFDNTNVEQA
jgi:hypothetical protein